MRQVSTPYALAALMALLCLLGTPLLAQPADNNWLPTGTDDYNVDANWEFNVVPELNSQFQDIAAINNGGTAVLSGAATTSGGISLTDGTLQIDRGGSLSTATDFGAPGTLNQTAGGQLQLGGLTGTTTASLNIAATATLGGQTRIIGPNADLSANAFVLSGLLNTVVTPEGSSALSTTGNAEIGGQLQLDFSGVTPTAGNTWTIVDAASVSGDGFASVSTGEPLAPGQLLRVQEVAGGNGTLLQASVTQGLLVTANRRTGELQLVNPSNAGPITLDGYLISSPQGSLRPAEWRSLSQQGYAGMTESNPTVSHLGELNLDGSNSIAANSRVSLGLVFDPTSLADQAEGDLLFEYHEAGGETLSTAVDYVGPYNELVLLVGSDGQTYLQNQSTADIVIDGYLITSESGSLDTGAWSPIATGDADWTSANPTSLHVGELRLSGGTILPAEGEAIDLGMLFDSAGVRDLVFAYHVQGGASQQATVVYDEVPFVFIAGDYNVDGAVDAIDYQVWRNTFGSTTLLAADGNRDGTVSLADYTIWRDNLGATAPAADAVVSPQAVPEPPGLITLLLISIAATASHCSRVKWS